MMSAHPCEYLKSPDLHILNGCIDDSELDPNKAVIKVNCGSGRWLESGRGNLSGPQDSKLWVHRTLGLLLCKKWKELSCLPRSRESALGPGPHSLPPPDSCVTLDSSLISFKPLVFSSRAHDSSYFLDC